MRLALPLPPPTTKQRLHPVDPDPHPAPGPCIHVKCSAATPLFCYVQQRVTTQDKQRSPFNGSSLLVNTTSLSTFKINQKEIFQSFHQRYKLYFVSNFGRAVTVKNIILGILFLLLHVREGSSSSGSKHCPRSSD